MKTQDYREMYRRSLDDPTRFWADVAQTVDWSNPWDRVLSFDESGAAVWFRGATTNTCWNALDRHLAGGRGNHRALIYDSPVTQTQQSFTYQELTELVARAAGMLQSLGVTIGDRVMIYMPAIPEAIISMLACARIGAIHTVVFGGFVAAELAARIRDCRPKVILAASCGIEINRIVPYKPAVDAACEATRGIIQACVIVQRPQMPARIRKNHDYAWHELMETATPSPCVPVSATDPLYIIYTSGTTGQPKGIVRPSGGHLVALAWSMSSFYDTQPGEIFWAASDIGWQVGHSYLVYGPLINGSTTVLYEGKPVGTPDAGAFWRVVNEHGVAALLTAPTAIRAIRREDPEGRFLRTYPLAKLRALFLAGERCDPPTAEWIERKLERPVVDHWWQTESGWPIAGNPLGIQRFRTKHGTVTLPMPGWDVRVLDEKGRPASAGQMGDIVCRLPLPPGAATTLWQAPDRYADAYLSRYQGYYLTGDAGYLDEDGYLSVMTRTDDVINVAGHRLSSGAIEEVIAGHPDVAECAVIGLDDSVKGQVPLGLLVLRPQVARSQHEVGQEVIQRVRDLMGAVVSLKQIVTVSRLPKTRSGKTLRATLSKMANCQDFSIPATIEDPLVLSEINAMLRSAGVGEAQDSNHRD